MLGRTFQLQDNLIDYNGHRARVEVVFDVSDHIVKERELQTVLDTQRELDVYCSGYKWHGTIDERLNAVLKKRRRIFSGRQGIYFLINKQGKLDNAYE